MDHPLECRPTEHGDRRKGGTVREWLASIQCANVTAIDRWGVGTVQSRARRSKATGKLGEFDVLWPTLVTIGDGIEIEKRSARPEGFEPPTLRSEVTIPRKLRRPQMIFPKKNQGKRRERSALSSPGSAG